MAKTVYARAGGSSTTACTGGLDDIRIYSKELSQDDIDLIYNSGSGTEDDSAPITDIGSYGRFIITNS